jgi:hypothetical protein
MSGFVPVLVERYSIFLNSTSTRKSNVHCKIYRNICTFCFQVEQIISESATADLKLEYCKQLTWYGLSDLVRKDAVRHNDGEQIAIYWKNDLLHFFSRNHPKYTILAHRLIAG